MALVRKFVPLELQRSTLHDEIEAKYAVFQKDGQGFVQINTYGRSTRDIPGKVSQSLQMDRQGAEQLIEILRKAFAL
jgi:hypothetical protein